MKARLARWRVLLPWMSLAIGLASALLMDRSARRAPLVAIAAGTGWLAVSGLVVAARILAERITKKAELAEKVAGFSHFVGMQSLTQLCVFFSLPFYVRAASFRVGHGAFLVLLAAVGAMSLWDPLCERVLKRPLTRAPTQAFATFAGLNCVLPIMGLSNRLSLYLAALAAAIGSPLFAELGRRLKEKKLALLQLSAGGVALALLLAGASSAVPPAPLRLTQAAIGTTIRDRVLVDPSEALDAVPRALVCTTAIAAPRGLRDELFHVWRHEGDVSDRVPLEISGGREAGYRTWSRKQHLGNSPSGAWSCTVETATGQILGGAKIVLSGE